MAGIPGKGGVKGRSGPKLKGAERMVPISVNVPPAHKAALSEKGQDWMRAVFAEALEKDA
ncbi:MAG: hypothetical protein ACTMKV_07735 [Sphingomonas parapaucimobilis]